MRSPVTVHIRPEAGFRAWYEGPLNPRIVVGADLAKLLTIEDLEAVVAHEIGHRELYHTERAHALYWLGYICAGLTLLLWGVVGASWAIAAAAFFAAAEFCLWLEHELEADAYAMRAFGAPVYLRAVRKMLRGQAPSGIALPLRLKIMERRCRT